MEKGEYFGVFFQRYFNSLSALVQYSLGRVDHNKTVNSIFLEVHFTLHVPAHCRYTGS